jgi:hypothetical protein
MFDVEKKRHASRTETAQTPINAGWEGWLAPAQDPNLLNVESK